MKDYGQVPKHFTRHQAAPQHHLLSQKPKQPKYFFDIKYWEKNVATYQNPLAVCKWRNS